MSRADYSTNGDAKAALYADLDRVPAGRIREDEPEVTWGEERPEPIIDRAAFYGLFGDIISTIEEQTEAHPAAMLFTLLAAFGNAIGTSAHAAVSDDEHAGRLFVALVGKTSSGGKGTSFGAIRPILRAADSEWLQGAHVNGFVSGEAIIAHANGAHCTAGEAVEKRIFVVEPEFARLLTVNSRDGSTASPIIRQAWDGAPLQLRRSKDKMVAEGAHVSILGHVTPDELRSKLTDTEVAGGFANRFLFVCVKRARKLPSGGYVPPNVIGDLARRLREAMDFARCCTIVRRTPAAEDLWAEFYMAEPDRDGLLGEVTARANAQKLRLSVLYALADGVARIHPQHVLAAEAAWRYAADSAEHIWGSDRTGDLIQDRLLAEAREVYPDGLSGTEQRDLFARKKSDEALTFARACLEKRGLIRIEKGASTGGRPASFIYALPGDQSDKRRQKTADELFGRLLSLRSPQRNGSHDRASSSEGSYIYYDSRDDEPMPELELSDEAPTEQGL